MRTRYFEIQMFASLILIALLTPATLMTTNIFLALLTRLALIIALLYFMYATILRFYWRYVEIKEDTEKITIKYPFRTITLEKKNIASIQTLDLKLFKRITYKTNDGKTYKIWD